MSDLFSIRLKSVDETLYLIWEEKTDFVRIVSVKNNTLLGYVKVGKLMEFVEIIKRFYNRGAPNKS